MEEKQENKEVEEFKFDISEPTEKFTKHLEVPFNDRIILSAPFGAGKTYFLKEYFKQNNDKYEPIHLFPINYSVASNKDIFELIKYDILFELFGKGVEFEKTDFDELDFLPFYLKDNKVSALETLTPLLAFIPKVGKTVADFSEQLLSFYKKFEKQFNKIQIDDEKAALHYLESFNKEKGSVYEDDFYSQLIRQLVNQLKKINKQGEQTKETVLIIDDLDRIDPGHIFRILNVLSAHMDKVAEENKFGFDKIILVFDQYNVRNIFKNRYGTDVDFTGYIDKFYTYKVFEFSNSKGLEKDLKRILETVQIINGSIDFKSDDFFVKSVIYTIKRMIQANVLSVRRLLKIRGQEMKYRCNLSSFNRVQRRFIQKVKVLFLAQILMFIYEDWDDLLRSIKEIQELEFDEGIDVDNGSYVRRILEESILLLDSEHHKFEAKSTYDFKHSQLKGAKYKVNFGPESGEISCALSLGRGDALRDIEILDNPKITQILYEALEFIKDRKIIQLSERV